MKSVSWASMESSAKIDFIYYRISRKTKLPPQNNQVKDAINEYFDI